MAVARSVFREHGAEASLGEIARRAGVGIGTLYRHFPTREALVAAVFADLYDESWQRAVELQSSDPPFEALASWLRAFTHHALMYQDVKPIVKLLIKQPGSPVYAPCSAMSAAGAALLACAQEAGAVRSDLGWQELLGLVHGIVAAAENTPRTPQGTELPDRLLDVVLAGLCAHPAAARARRTRS